MIAEPPPTEHDKIGASLASVLSSFDERTASLRSMLSLRGLGPEAFSTLERLELQLTALEGDVAAARGAIMCESSLLAEAAELQRCATASTTAIAQMTANLPELLPGDRDVSDGWPATTTVRRPPLSEIGAETAAVNPPPPPPPASAPAASTSANSSRASTIPRPTAASKHAPPPQLALVTDSELASAPSYMRSRLDVPKVCEYTPRTHVSSHKPPRTQTSSLHHLTPPPLLLTQVNAALMEVQKILTSKYTLLHAPAASVRSMPDAERKRHAGYKALEPTDGSMKGVYFVTEEDLKASSSIKNDASGKNVLAVLRHVGRLKEFKHGGMRCWQARG